MNTCDCFVGGCILNAGGVLPANTACAMQATLNFVAGEGANTASVVPAVPREATPYEMARRQFDTYARMDTGEYPTDPNSRMQVEIYRWGKDNFGSEITEETSAMGVSEELGELAESLLGLVATSGRLHYALLKKRQGVRGITRDVARELIGDALADMLIFATYIATHFRIDLWTIYRETAKVVLRRDWKKDALAGGQAQPQGV